MAEKKITISLEQINDIVSDAVASAIRKIENIEVVEHQPTDSETQGVKVGEFSKEQLDEAIDLIYEEYDLPREKTIVQKANHWDIGQTWND